MQTLFVLALPAVLAAGRLHLHFQAMDRRREQLRASRAPDARRVRRAESNVVPLRAARLMRRAA